MKIVLVHAEGDDGEVLLRMSSEFPPIDVSKWLHASGDVVRIRYGRARLKKGFCYFYAPREEQLGHRVAAVEPLTLTLGAVAIVYPSSFRSAEVDQLLAVCQRTATSLVELAAPNQRRSRDVVRVSPMQGRQFDDVSRYDFAAKLDERGSVLAGLWDLYQQLGGQGAGIRSR